MIVKDDQYFKNSINANIFLLNEYIKKIDKPVSRSIISSGEFNYFSFFWLRNQTNKSEWDMAPPVVNAYYAPTKNQIGKKSNLI